MPFLRWNDFFRVLQVIVTFEGCSFSAPGISWHKQRKLEKPGNPEHPGPDINPWSHSSGTVKARSHNITLYDGKSYIGFPVLNKPTQENACTLVTVSMIPYSCKCSQSRKGAFRGPNAVMAPALPWTKIRPPLARTPSRSCFTFGKKRMMFSKGLSPACMSEHKGQGTE